MNNKRVSAAGWMDVNPGRGFIKDFRAVWNLAGVVIC